MVLHSCTCAFARDMNRQIAGWIDQGWTLDQILAELQRQYGPTVLAAPPTRGFYLSAWVLPFIAVIVGGAGLIWILRRRKIAHTESESLPEPDEMSTSWEDIRSMIESVDR